MLEKDYIEGSNGRTAILKKLDKKPVRVVAFNEDKFPMWNHLVADAVRC